MRVALGQFVVDTQLGRPWKNGVELKLREQPLQVLIALVRDPGEIVSRDSLRQQLWVAVPTLTSTMASTPQ